jgi:hypothetical protein
VTDTERAPFKPAATCEKEGPSGSFLFTEFDLGRCETGSKANIAFGAGFPPVLRGANRLLNAFLRGVCFRKTSLTRIGLGILQFFIYPHIKYRIRRKKKLSKKKKKKRCSYTK